MGRGSPMTDEELIEKARVAYVEAWEAERKKIGRGVAEPGTKSRAGIIAALAVFREHTAPTDDERETVEQMRDRLLPGVLAYASLEGLTEAGVASAALRIGITEALRRGAPTEPAVTDGMVKRALDEYLRAETGGKVRAMRAALEAALSTERGEGDE